MVNVISLIVLPIAYGPFIGSDLQRYCGNTFGVGIGVEESKVS